MRFIKAFSFYLIASGFLVAQSYPRINTITSQKDKNTESDFLKNLTSPSGHRMRPARRTVYRGPNLGLLFGKILSFNEIASGGLSFGANVAWVWSKHLASSFVFSTGSLSGKDITLSGTSNSTSKIVNIEQSSANLMRFISFALGGRFYYPMGKFNPGVGVYLDFSQFRGPTYSLSSSLSVKFEFVAWYNIWKQLDIGLDLFYGLGSITKISDSSDTYALSSSLSGSSLNILLAARYRVFNL